MKNYSLTIQSVLVLFVAFMKEVLGIEFTASEYETALMVVVGLVAGFLGWYGRVRAGGVNKFGKRVTEQPKVETSD